MSEEGPNPVVEALRAIAAGQDEPISTFAADLIPAAEAMDADTTSPVYREIRERISALVVKHATTEPGPTIIIDALVQIDEHLGSRNATWVPFATRLCALAAERALHAEREQRREQSARELSERSPIFPVGKDALYAVPVGSLGKEGLIRFSERVLACALTGKARRLVLVLTGQDPADRDAERAFKNLVQDLKAQRIQVDMI